MAGLDPAQDESGLMSSINITPFVDVTLVLLIIFIVTAPMLVKDVLDLRLPKTSVSDGQAAQTLGLAINRDGNFLLNGTLADEDTLKTAVEAALVSNPAVQGIIAADLEVPYGRVVKLIEILKLAGLERFAVQIEKSESKTGVAQ
jgi:biopolymer transport protein ExbD